MHLFAEHPPVDAHALEQRAAQLVRKPLRLFCLSVPGDTREVVTPMTHTNGTAKDATNDHDDRYAAPTAHDQSVG